MYNIKCADNLYQQALSMFLTISVYDNLSQSQDQTVLNKQNQDLIKAIEVLFKGAWSYLSKFSFPFHLTNYYSKHVNFKFQLKRSSRLDVQSNFVYYSQL